MADTNVHNVLLYTIGVKGWCPIFGGLDDLVVAIVILIELLMRAAGCTRSG